MRAGFWNANSRTNEIAFKFGTEYGFRHTQPSFHNLFIRELDEIDIGSPRTSNEITPAHLGKVELSEWTTNEVSEQNRELLCRGSLHGIRCHPEQ